MKKKNSKFSRLTTVIISLVATVMSSLTVFAYEPLQSSTEEPVSNLSDGDFMEFISYEDDNEFYKPDININFGNYEKLFVSDSGEYTYIESSDASTNAICNHKFELGTLYAHASNGKGGCTVYEYSAERCLKCNYIKTKELINTITFAKCTHS